MKATKTTITTGVAGKPMMTAAAARMTIVIVATNP
jgi:hypothetical protein